jgi:catecholate siderophore receptor
MKSSRRRKNRKRVQRALRLTALIMAQGMSATHAQTPVSDVAPSNGDGAASAPPRDRTTNEVGQLREVVITGERPPENKPDIVSSPLYTEPLSDIPQTITVVPRVLIEQQNATTLRDVLRNVPGISMQAGEGGVPNGDNLSIRGFNARTDLFVDGVRDFGGYTRDPFNVEQIEVTKGPASSYSGRGSTGGNINLSSKGPSLHPLYAGSMGFGTENYLRFTTDVNQPIGNLGLKGTALRLNGMWTEGDTAGRDSVESSRWGVAPSVAFGLGTPTRLTLSYFHLDQNNIPDYGLPWVPANTNAALAAFSDKPAPVEFSNFYGLVSRDYERTRTDLPTAKLEHDFTSHLTLRNLTRYGHTERDSVITAPRFVNANTNATLLNRQLQSRDQEDTIWANQTYLTSQFDSWKIGHTLVAGVEYIHESSDNYARTGPLSQTDLFNPNPRDAYPGPITRTGAKTEATSDSLALSLFDTIKLGEQWQLTGGLRWDYFDLGFRSIATNGVSLLDLDRTDEMLSWRVGIVYKPRPNGSIYAAYGTSFNPSGEGLALANTASALNNINTEPEENRSYEIGTKWELFDQRLALSLAVFRTEKTNARTEDPADATDIVVLEGEQRVDGIELGVAGNLTDDWQIFAGYAYLRSDITKSKIPAEEGKELSNTPSQTFNLWTTYRLPWHFEVGGGVQFTDSRFSSTANTREAPSYWVGDAMVAWSPAENFTMRLNVYNLTDEKYIDRVGGGHFVPGTGRSAVVSANWRF